MSTATIAPAEIGRRVRAVFPDAILAQDEHGVVVRASAVVEVGRFLRDDPELDGKYLNSLTAVDWMDHFDVVYHVSSLAKNHTFVLKARASHDTPVVPSMIDVWQGADLQEREVYDLMGIGFSGHPNMKRIFLWEGFPGHPLRKDFLALPGGYKPGLQRFPYEFPEGQQPGYGATQTPTSNPPTPSAERGAERGLGGEVDPATEQTEGRDG